MHLLRMYIRGYARFADVPGTAGVKRSGKEVRKGVYTFLFCVGVRYLVGTLQIASFARHICRCPLPGPKLRSSHAERPRVIMLAD